MTNPAAQPHEIQLIQLAPGKTLADMQHEYVAICFVPDKADGKPHFEHGMARQFTVT